MSACVVYICKNDIYLTDPRLPAPSPPSAHRLLLRTLAKPLATKLKTQAKEHEGFRTTTVAIAQFLHKREMQMRLSLLGETLAKHHVKPLNDAKAVEQGANFISESFLFAIAASISTFRFSSPSFFIVAVQLHLVNASVLYKVLSS